ncbi:hypothetical protein CUD01_16640 [Cellulomonas uda]|uniref:Uncharacterized protein n=1 Tax=Cellulomonas uda TaxID=1714 RepID=A0A4Y3KE72_CELUD|nr:hypothetical protein CUD01_16640 [Cellulomonas uda]
MRGAPPPGPASSTTEPHDWHSPHRPTHFVVVHPHSVHRNPGVREAEDRPLFVATARTLAAASDIPRTPCGSGATRACPRRAGSRTPTRDAG